MAEPSRRCHDIAGQRFGRLVALNFVKVTKERSAIWNFKCDCGHETLARARNVRQGRTTSCGCLRSEKARERALARGLAKVGTEAWKAVSRKVERLDVV